MMSIGARSGTDKLPVGSARELLCMTRTLRTTKDVFCRGLEKGDLCERDRDRAVTVHETSRHSGRTFCVAHRAAPHPSEQSLGGSYIISSARAERCPRKGLCQCLLLTRTRRMNFIEVFQKQTAISTGFVGSDTVKLPLLRIANTNRTPHCLHSPVPRPARTASAKAECKSAFERC